MAVSFAANLALPSPAAARGDPGGGPIVDGFEGIVVNLWDLDAAGHNPFEGYAFAFEWLVGVQLLVVISCLAHDLFTFLVHSNFTLEALNGLGERLLPAGVALAVGCVALFIASL
jgi:hypothetical protein